MLTLAETNHLNEPGNKLNEIIMFFTTFNKLHFENKTLNFQKHNYLLKQFVVKL